MRTGWTNYGYFTKFMFDRPLPESENESNVELEHVEIDLTRTDHAFQVNFFLAKVETRSNFR